MAPAVTLDNESDFDPVSINSSTNGFHARVLLLAPPSISSHEEKLRNVLSQHDRSVTDLQMLDRLAAGLITLPSSTYDSILILTDADGSRNESQHLLSRTVFTKIVEAMKAGGKLQAQDGSFGQNEGMERTEGILAGLVAISSHGMVKPEYSASEAVPLRFNKKKVSGLEAGPIVPSGLIPLNSNAKGVDVSKGKPAGVGFVDFSDDFGEPMITGEDDDDDELIDEDTLLTEEDLKRPIVVRMFHPFL
jgi:hypothetical protein